MASPTAQYIDARHSNFTEVHGSVYNYTTLPQTNLTELHRFCVNNASWNPQHLCLEGTRTSFIDDIDHWVNSSDQNTPRLFLVTGVAGSGKSSLAHTIAQRFDERGCLGSSFFFDHAIAGRDNISQVFTTIARDLAAVDPMIHSKILQQIQTTPSILSAPITRQFHQLILLPTRGLALARPVVIVIDALDESGSRTARREFLAILRDHFQELPPCFRIVLTGRSEEDILDAFRSQEICIRHVIDVCSEANINDLSIYLKHRLSAIAKAKHLDSSWPGAQIERDLEWRARGLFIWASTACNFIEQSRAPKKQLQLLLSERPSQRAELPLDSLYLMALEHAHDWEDEDFVTGFQLIVGAIMVAKTPLSALALTALHGAVLSELWGEDGLTAADFIRPLGCLLRGVDNPDANVSIQALHPSFHDFLTTRGRCQNEMFYVDRLEHNSRMTTLCLELMNKSLKYDICGFGNPSVRNHSASLLVKNVPEALIYACKFWSSHILNSGPHGTPAFTVPFQQFLCEHFLHWTEVMSILGLLDFAGRSLRDLSQWLQTNASVGLDAVKIVDDGRRFISKFSHKLISNFPLHIYVSALQWTPMNTKLYQTYFHTRAHSFPRVVRGFYAQWPLLVSATCFASGVTSVAWSPDGSYIITTVGGPLMFLHAETGNLDRHQPDWYGSSVAISLDGSLVVTGSRNKIVVIWDVTTRHQVGQDLRGHTGPITSVAFSPNGSYVVSGSKDNTIRLWDTKTGRTVVEPLQGHTSEVTSVAVSPDGLCVVSGTADNTVRIWDAKSGKPIGEPLRGHTTHVKTVAVSPNGLYIASGSQDHTVRLWDAKTGCPIGQPLQGHTSTVTSVVFSPDGSRIVSGSGDKTVRIWDTESGSPIGEPLINLDWISCVAFSPDGTRIACGAYDRILRIWDVDLASSTRQSLHGHSLWITSVALSPNGSQIVTGSGDKTLRIWDAESGSSIGPLQGHMSFVTCVAYSENGLRIVSGSEDHTLRIWDAVTGNHIGGPLQGHTDRITSTAFTLDGTRIVSGSRDFTLRIWDVETGNTIGVPLLGHTDWIASAAFSQCGKYISSRSEDDTVNIWIAETQTLVQGSPYPIPIFGSIDHEVVGSTSPPALTPNGWLRMGEQNVLWMPPVDLDKYRLQYAHGTLVLWHNMDFVIIRTC